MDSQRSLDNQSTWLLTVKFEIYCLRICSQHLQIDKVLLTCIGVVEAAHENEPRLTA